MDSENSEYFAEATRWEIDRSKLLRDSARRAWRLAAVASFVAAISAAAVAALSPLKHVEPFLVRVDSTSGVVDVVPIYTGTASLPDSVTRHLVTEYVCMRERYVPAIAASDYEQVGAYHTAVMNQRWGAAWARTNSESPLNRYGDSATVRVQVQSVAFLKKVDGEAVVLQVRFLTATQRVPGGPEEVAQFIATVEVAYGRPSEEVRVRAMNPLGFKVLEYRREPEVRIPTAELPAVAAAGGSP